MSIEKLGISDLLMAVYEAIGYPDQKVCINP
jgi:hypothetical protein